MPTLQSPPTSVKRPSAARGDAWLDISEARGRRRAFAVGAAATLLIHLLAAIFGPRLVPIGGLLVPFGGRAPTAEEQSLPKEFLLQLADAPPPSYVEANPNAPVNVPDRAEHFSSRDQQSASEKLVQSPKDDPFVEGEQVQSQKILPGERPAPLEEMPPPAPPPAPIVPPGISLAQPSPDAAEKPAETTKPAEQLPDLPEGSDTSEGIGRTPSEQEPERVARRGEIYGPAGQRPLPQRDQAPAARPQLAPTVLPGIVQRRDGGSMRSGMTAVNAKFSEFGEYQARMWDAIVQQWYRLADGQDAALVIPSEVQVRFRIDQEGDLVELEVLRSSAGTIGTLLVRDAIQGRAPFGPFTQEMRRALNRQEEFIATFRYVYF